MKREVFGAQHTGLNRRSFLRTLGILSATAALPAKFGCKPDEAEPTVLPHDPDQPWWLQSNFAPVFEELYETNLEVHGSIPPELHGLYVRNGSNPASGESGHWFFGDGMVHGVMLESGKALWYRNRFVQTDLYKNGQSAGVGGASNASNVSAFNHSGRLYTSGEVGYPFQLSTSDLSTIGVTDFDGSVRTAFTAHPKVDPRTGNLHSFGYWFMNPYLTYRVYDADGANIVNTEIAVGASTMIHSFAITEQDVVFWECPVVFDLGAATSGADAPYKWTPEYGTRIGVLPLGGEGSDVRWVEIPNCYVFHEANAFRDGDDIIVDVLRHPSMFENDSDLTNVEGSFLARWRVNTSGEELTFTEEEVSSLPIELPTHDRRYTGSNYRHSWWVESRDHPYLVDFAGITHIDMQTGAHQRWEPGLNRHANEAFFVAGGLGEGEGWLFTYVWDHMTDESVLAILDALDVQAGPIAEIVLPQRVPFGFHGSWFPVS